MHTIKLLAVAAIFVIGCGDNKSNPDARDKDAQPLEAFSSNFPNPPTLGAQIDRVGRPAVNTVLNHGFDGDMTMAQPAKAAYNQNGDSSTWLSPAIIAEFAKNLAIVDALDTTTAGTGCGNQALYNGGAGGAAAPDSYFSLAGILANDRMFLDTGKTTCTFYLAVEFGLVAGAYTTCGGRAPEYDVVDFSYSMLASGVNGFTPGGGGFTPKIGDGVDVHADLKTDFPYLGDPH